ncbi:MAG: hypothetical protein LBN21_06120 [Treponema sp.]|jgi:hypothetical protein|nr:hypothetical protein [Treponema sp.]
MTKKKVIRRTAAASRFLTGVLFLFVLGGLWAEDETTSGITSGRNLVLSISTLPELKLAFNQNWVFPFLQGEGALTAGNNIKLNLSAEVTPISLNGIAEATWTPIAFLQVVAGTKLGTGWNIELGDFLLYGIGINTPGPLNSDGIPERTMDGTPFGGLTYNFHLGSAFQIDMAAFVPGDWNHIVFRTYHEGTYMGFSEADADDSWVYEDDFSQRRNGFTYYGNFLLGYQMPIFLNTVGLLAEVNQNLYTTSGRDVWGDDLGQWLFSALFNFTITPKISAALIVQTKTFRNYTDSTSKIGDREKKTFYQNRVLDTDNPLRLEFYRVAAVATFTLP